jgi:hypothetical protein
LTAYAAVAAFSAVISVSPSLSLAKWCILICTLVCAGAFGPKIVELHGGMAARKWTRAWILCLSPVLTINILALLTGLGGENYVQGAFRGLSGNSNSLGSVLAVVLPLLVCPFVYRRRRPDARAWLLAALALGSGLVLIQSWSRASIAAFSVGLLSVWWVHPRNRLTRYMAVAAVVVLMFAVFALRRSLAAKAAGTSLLTARTVASKVPILELVLASPASRGGWSLVRLRR